MKGFLRSWHAVAIASLIFQVAFLAVDAARHPATPPAAWRPSPYGTLSIPLEWAIRCP